MVVPAWITVSSPIPTGPDNITWGSIFPAVLTARLSSAAAFSSNRAQGYTASIHRPSENTGVTGCFPRLSWTALLSPYSPSEMHCSMNGKVRSLRQYSPVKMMFDIISWGFSCTLVIAPFSSVTTPYFEGLSLSTTIALGHAPDLSRSPTERMSMTLSPGSTTNHPERRSLALSNACPFPSCFSWTTYSILAPYFLPSSKWDMRRSLRYPTTITISRMLFLTNESTTYPRIGRFAIGIMTLGSDTVKGLNRIPSPAASTTAFMRNTPAHKLHGRADLRVL